MKQYAIINNELKMSKGKIARICLSLGFQSYDLINVETTVLWEKNIFKAVILKTDNYDKVLSTLDSLNVNYKEHIDLVLTCVPKDSHCGVVFFGEDGGLFKDLKLL